MGWFDEQLRQREQADNAVFEDSFQAIGGAIMGRRMSQALNDDRQTTADAIGEILKYYHIKPQEAPESTKDAGIPDAAQRHQAAQREAGKGLV